MDQFTFSFDSTAVRSPDFPGPPQGGVVGWLRDAAGGYPGPNLAGQPNVADELEHEQVKAGPWIEKMPWFLPYFDDQTGETPQMRQAYRKMFADPNVKAALLGKLIAVAALDPQFVPADKKSQRDRDVAKFLEWTITERLSGGLPELAWNVLIGGLLDGFSVNEKVWAVEKHGRYAGKIGLAKLKPKDVNHELVLETDPYRNVVSIRGLRYNPGQQFDPRNFVIYTHMPLYGAPTGTSDLRAAYGRYWVLDTVLKLRASGLEKRALPLLMGTYSNPTQKPSLDSALAGAKSSNWISAPDGCKVEAINIAGMGDAMFAEAIRDLKHDIFLAIQGAILQAVEGSITDARGSSAIHKETSELLVWYLARTLEAILNNHDGGLVCDIVDLNFVVSEYPRVLLSAVDIGELQAELTISTGLHQLGLDLSKDQLYEKYHHSPPIDEADKLSGQGGGDTEGGFNQPGLPFDEEGEQRANPTLTAGETMSPAETKRERQTALAGRDGAKAESLLKQAMREGTAVLGTLTAGALRRVLKGPSPKLASSLFSDSERQRLADALAATNASAELLARARIRERQRKAESNAGAIPFAEDDAPFESFADPVPLLSPLQALSYFLNLVPTIGVDPKRFGPDHARDAFTLAQATEQTLLGRVQKIIADLIESGKGINASPANVNRILDAAGVTPRNPQYAEMVVRTNMMDAYNTGATRELQDPDVSETFPVWRYVGIRDGRQGSDHEPHFDRYYPNSVAFAEVRGDRPYNCRCTQIPVSKFDWKRLREQGATLSRFAEHRFSTAYFQISDPKPILQLASKILDSDLVAKGRESEPHVTVKYGLHTNNSNDVAKVVRGFGPVTLTLGRVSMFPANERQLERGDMFDVLKVDVHSDQIRELNRAISDALPFTDTHSNYVPHLTLAYVRPGCGAKYVGDDQLEGTKIVCDRLVFSDRDRQQHIIPLASRHAEGGQPPGPPPRPGLEWNSQSHRWVRPEDKSSGSTKPQSTPPKKPEGIYERGEKVAKKHHQNMRAMLGRMVRGEYHADDVLTDLPKYRDQAAASISNNYVGRYKAWRDKVEAKLGPDILRSPEWGAVRDAFKAARDQAVKSIDAMANVVVANAEWMQRNPGKKLEVHRDDLEALGDHHNSLVAHGNKAIDAIADALVAFRAKHKFAEIDDFYEEFATDPWQPYVGQKGAKKGVQGWKHSVTKKVVWGDKPGSKKDSKPTPTQTVAALNGAIESKSSVSDELAAQLSGHTVAELKEIKKQINAKGGKIKSELVTAIKSKVEASLSPSHLAALNSLKTAITNKSGMAPEIESGLWELSLPELKAVKKEIGAKASGSKSKLDVITAITTHVNQQMPFGPVPVSSGFTGPGNEPNASLPNESRPAVTLQEQEAINRYTGTEYEVLNRGLFAGDKMAKATTQLHHSLQGVFARLELFSTPVNAFRGLDLEDPKQYIGMFEAAKKLGHPVSLSGYQSTSTDENRAFTGNIRIHIEAVRGLDVMPYSGNPDERELLLNHGERFDVLSIDEINGIHHIRLRQLS